MRAQRSTAWPLPGSARLAQAAGVSWLTKLHPHLSASPDCAGVLLNQLLPNWAVTLLLIPLLCHLTLRMGKTALRLYQAESVAAAAGHLLPGQEVPRPPNSQPDNWGGEGGGGEAEGAATQQQQQQHGCCIPWGKAAELLILWVVLLTFQHAKAHSGGLQFAALYAAQAAAAVGASGFFIWQVNRAGGHRSITSPAVAAAAATAAAAPCCSTQTRLPLVATAQRCAHQ